MDINTLIEQGSKAFLRVAFGSFLILIGLTLFSSKKKVMVEPIIVPSQTFNNNEKEIIHTLDSIRKLPADQQLELFLQLSEEYTKKYQ